MIGLIKLNKDLTYEELVLLYLLYHGDKVKYHKEIQRYKEKNKDLFFSTLRKLEGRSLVQIKEDRVKIYTSKVRLRMGDSVQEDKESLRDEIEIWIDEYRKIFKKSNRKDMPMGDRNRTIKNMVWLFQNHPELADKKNVIEAAERYVRVQKEQNQYTRRADYFIKKIVLDNDGNTLEVSDMLTYLEDISSSDKILVNNYGRKIV